MLNDPLLQEIDPESLIKDDDGVDDADGLTLSWHRIKCFVPTTGESSDDATGDSKRQVADAVAKPETKACFAQGLHCRKPPNLKLVLADVSGHVRPGEMLAVMGPSGSGKTTLLNLLAGREQLGDGGWWEGSLRINGQAPAPGWQRDLGFVMQRDIFYECLSVQEELKFAAALRLPPSLTSQARALRVSEVVESLGLGGVLRTKIGSAVDRGLSGGELKRLNIAVELLADPRILLLDEPLTGLDSTKAAAVLQTLRERATQKRRSVALSIHQPSSKLFSLFDRLLILAPGGHKIYLGPANEASSFFDRSGFPTPLNWNVTDHFIEVVSDKTHLAQLLGQVANFEASNLHPAQADHEEERAHDPTTAVLSAPPPPLVAVASGSVLPSSSPSFHQDGGAHLPNSSSRVPRPPPQTREPCSMWRQVAALSRRGIVTAKGSLLTPIEFSLVLCLAGIWGGLWFGVGKGSKASVASHAPDVISIVFFIAAQWSWGPAFQQLCAFPRDRDVLVKELASGAYSIEAYYAAKLGCELPISTVLPAAFFVVLWPLVGLPWGSLVPMYSVTLLVSWTSSSLAMAISAILFDTQTSMTVMIIILVYLMCAGGFFIDLTTQPWYISWLRFTSYWYYALGLLMQVLLPYDTKVAVDGGGGGEARQEGALRSALDSYSFSLDFSPGENALALALFGIAFRLIAFFALKFSSKIRFS